MVRSRKLRAHASGARRAELFAVSSAPASTGPPKRRRVLRQDYVRVNHAGGLSDGLRLSEEPVIRSVITSAEEYRDTDRGKQLKIQRIRLSSLQLYPFLNMLQHIKHKSTLRKNI